MPTERPALKTGRRFTAWYIVAAVLLIALGLFTIIKGASSADVTAAPNGRLAGQTWADLCFHLRLSLTFQVLVQLATLALLGPLMAWGARRLVLLSGQPLVTNFDLAAFALSPGG